MRVSEKIKQINEEIKKRGILMEKTHNYNGELCVIRKRTYEEGGGTALTLEDPVTGELITVATINVPELNFLKGFVVIKDYSENEGMLNFLIQNNIVSKPLDWVPLGYVLAPICKLLI